VKWHEMARKKCCEGGSRPKLTDKKAPNKRKERSKENNE